ncbi:MAG: phage integrase N-terminal SAM-like domain-containing protein [Polyangiaceae bacterium]|nr:phage integrase N-terminal SAM-like domain-containing protein [Polyangiaceae bacterium]
MIEDLQLRNYARGTCKQYVACARTFVAYHRRPPQEMGELEVRQFLMHVQLPRTPSSVGVRARAHPRLGLPLGDPAAAAGVGADAVARGLNFRQGKTPQRGDLPRRSRSTQVRRGLASQAVMPPKAAPHTR